jgi:hypothetical protein
VQLDRRKPETPGAKAGTSSSPLSAGSCRAAERMLSLGRDRTPNYGLVGTIRVSLLGKKYLIFFAFRYAHLV